MVKKVAFVLASGPSLTLEDIERVKQSGAFTVAVNTTWEKAQFCDVLYAGDNGWWKHHIKRIEAAALPAARWGCSKPAQTLYDAKYRERRVKPGYNSGANAGELAAHMGYNVIIYLGLDCSVKYGTHHHGDHEKTANPTQNRCEQWQRQFKSLSKLYPKVTFLNCSRYTELKAFKTLPLEEALEHYF